MFSIFVILFETATQCGDSIANTLPPRVYQKGRGELKHKELHVSSTHVRMF